jgi:spore maturation protein CgeB
VTILLSGAFNPRFAALPEYLAAALRRLGHRVVLFDHRAFLLPGRLRDRCARLDALDRRALNLRFLRAVRRHRPDLALVNQGMVLDPRTIERARRLGVRCVNWFSDYPAEFDAGLRAAPAYDAFFLASSYAVERHRAAGLRGSAWLPFGCDPEIHRPAADGAGPGAPAVVFVGSWYPERQVLLRFLRGLPVGIWGPGWERAAGDPQIAPMLRGPALRPAAWRELYGGARVVLNIHYGCFGPREVGGDLANTRVFEILACGAYQVVDRQGDVVRLFREGEHLAAFSSGDEMRVRVEEGLRDEDRRAAVAERGRAAVLAEHTYGHRARRLVASGAARGLDTAAPAPAGGAALRARPAGGSSR